MQEFINQMKSQARENPQRIIFPEATCERILKACEILVEEEIAFPILVGDPVEIKKAARDFNVSLECMQIICPEKDSMLDLYAKEFFSMRKHRGMTMHKALETMKDPIYFGTMMVKLEDADGLVCGAVTTTAGTLRPALQIIKTKEKFHKVSGMFLMLFENRLLVFADCAVNINPDAKDLCEIAIDVVETARSLNIDPRVAFLSFATDHSANHAMVDKVREAWERFRENKPGIPSAGPIQMDAALREIVRKLKWPNCSLKENANILIFPTLNSGNICSKSVEILGGAHVVGPILLGLNKPLNDLSRSCTVRTIVDTTIVTVVQAQGRLS